MRLDQSLLADACCRWRACRRVERNLARAFARSPNACRAPQLAVGSSYDRDDDDDDDAAAVADCRRRAACAALDVRDGWVQPASRAAISAAKLAPSLDIGFTDRDESDDRRRQRWPRFVPAAAGVDSRRELLLVVAVLRAPSCGRLSRLLFVGGSSSSSSSSLAAAHGGQKKSPSGTPLRPTQSVCQARSQPSQRSNSSSRSSSSHSWHRALRIESGSAASSSSPEK